MKSEVLKWLAEIEQIDGVPPKEVVAFNLGISESEDGFMLYLVGGFQYSEENDDWACLEMPENPYRYLALPALVQILPKEEVLEICQSNLKELEKEGAFRNNILKNAKAITTGFNDGELIKIR